MARLPPILSFAVSTTELANAMAILSRTGITASQAAERLRESMARLSTLPIHNNVETTQTVCPVCEEEERRETRCPATELLDISARKSPMPHQVRIPKYRLIRDD